jgi:2-polyprenyl-3-methyl-5-hydroxy-6-metoxy-1,4-benzoquinol methylase
MDESYWDERYSGSDLVWTAEANRFVAAECSTLPTGSALDLACGEGRNSVWLAGRGWSVTGVDWSAVGLAKGEKLAAAVGVAVHWVHADVLTWSPERTYDLVLLAYLQIDLAGRHTAMQIAAAAAAPGGSVLVVAHDLSNLTAGVGGPQNPDVLWRVEDAQAPGLTAVRAEVAERPTAAGIALDTVVRLVRDR